MSFSTERKKSTLIKYMNGYENIQMDIVAYLLKQWLNVMSADVGEWVAVLWLRWLC